MYLGDFSTSAILYTKFNTINSYGAPSTLSGATLKVYRDDSSTTEVTTGVTMTIDFDTTTGLNNIKVDTSTDGTFYSTGHDFMLVLTAGTVDSTSIAGYVIGSFSIGNRSILSSSLDAILSKLGFIIANVV